MNKLFKPSNLWAISLTLSLLVPISSQATITSGTVTTGSGMFFKLAPGFTESDPDNTVGNNTFQNTNLYGFDEGQNIAITMDLNVDILADGLGGEAGSGMISMGTTVASHYIFFDPAGTASQVGTVTFDSNVVAVITSKANLEASDTLINTGVTYLSPTLRGLESGDDVSIISLDTIEVDWRAGTPGDYVRVLTGFSPGAVIPIPAAFWLFGTAMVGLASIAKRRKA